jgi:hypothetical protein
MSRAVSSIVYQLAKRAELKRPRVLVTDSACKLPLISALTRAEGAAQQGTKNRLSRPPGPPPSARSLANLYSVA